MTTLNKKVKACTVLERGVRARHAIQDLSYERKAAGEVQGKYNIYGMQKLDP